MKRPLTFLIFCSLVCIIMSACHTPQGKSSVIFAIEMSQPDLLRKWSDNSRDTLFNKAIERAQQMQETDTRADFITLFDHAYTQADSTAQLAAIFGYVPKFQKMIDFHSSNKQVIAALRWARSEALQTTASVIEKRFKSVPAKAVGIKNVLQERIKEYNAPVVKVSVVQDPPQIIVQLTGFADLKGARNLVLSSGRLEFWDTYENEEIYPYLAEADKVFADELKKHDTGETNEKRSRPAPVKEKNFFEDAVITTDSNGKSEKAAPPVAEDTTTARKGPGIPLLSVLMPATDGKSALRPGCAVGICLGKDTAWVNRVLSIPRVRAVFPRDLRFMWAAKPYNEKYNVYELYAIKVNLYTHTARLDGDAVTEARQGYDMSGTPDVTITMNAAGSILWQRMTENAVNGQVNGRAMHRSVALSMDGAVYSAPRVTAIISGGRTEISGIGSVEEAQSMAGIFSGGALPAPVRLVEERPSVGH